MVFLLDVDNTLLDNDRFGADLGARLEQSFGAERERYWQIFADLRANWGLRTIWAACRRFAPDSTTIPGCCACRIICWSTRFQKPGLPAGRWRPSRILKVSAGPVVLSDGDVVFQPRKIQRSGIWDAVGAACSFTCTRKSVLDHVQLRYPARTT
jgi:hypothetical protein